MSEEPGYMILIGASAGGMSAISQLLSGLRPDIPAAIGVVIHLPEKGENQLFLNRLQKSTSLPCHIADDSMPLKSGQIYFAPAGYHMLIKEKKIALGKGPSEGSWRPSINASLRAAAVAWNSHCIGIILTGMLDDGTAGMDAVQRCGGFTIVQDPEEAEYPNMPLSVLNHMQVDRILPVSDIPQAIEERLAMNLGLTGIPDDLRIENARSERMSTAIEGMSSLGRQAVYSCLDCGGSLWEVNNGEVHEYRCHIGHTYTEEELLHLKGQEMEKTLWVALRTMEEKRNLLQKIARAEEKQGLHVLFRDHQQRAKEMQQHINQLKSLLLQEQRTGTG